MSVPSDASNPVLIDFDLPCTTCGYNLRALQVIGSCPECSQPVMRSIDLHMRRRISRFDLTRFRDWPERSLRSIWRGACYAILANTIALTLIHLPTWMFRRSTPSRTVLLVIVCFALAFAAMSIWRFAVRTSVHRKLGVGQWMLRTGAVGAVLWPVTVAVQNDDGTLAWTNLRSLFGDGPLVMMLAAWIAALGTVGRLAYMHWWLRLEGFGLLGWPLLLAAIPIGGFFFFFAPFGIRNYYRGNFVSLDFFLEVPLASGSWPLAVGEVLRMLPRLRLDRLFDPDFLLPAMALPLQGLVFACDAILGVLAVRELARRRRAIQDDTLTDAGAQPVG
jgi:hypothetical protein